MKNSTLLLLFMFIIHSSCFNGSDALPPPSFEKNQNVGNYVFVAKEAILLADREAPLGWVYLRMYNDSSFEFETRGLERSGTIYDGKFHMRGDSIFFKYKAQIPNAGKTAVLSNDLVSYIDGKYHERVQIKLNKLRNKPSSP